MRALLRVISKKDKSASMDRVQELLESSKKMIRDCSLENGAIVAANSDKEYYPENVANYRFVWPRDAAFTLYAADILEMEQLESRFFDWMVERAEGFELSGIIYHRYSTNGPRDTDFGHQYQPDQAAALLWATLDTNKELSDEQREIIHLIADGLWKQWSDKSFHQNSHDLWEEREAHVDKNENFTYTVAACSKALFLAAERLGEQKWRSTAEEMRDRLKEHEIEKDDKSYFPRTYGDISDETVDAAALGLVWPFDVVEDRERLKNTVKLIEEDLLQDEGVMRYRGDMYDGMVHHTQHLKKGAGPWPLLSFWHCIALEELGEKERAKELFEKQISAFEGELIPEQILKGDNRSSIRPLAWSHAMFVIAADRLGYMS